MIQEQLVLAAILIDNRHMKKSRTMIEPSDFVDFKNKSIYQGMISLDDKVMDINYGTLMTYLDAHKTGITIDYLIELENYLPTAEAIDSYLAQLKEVSNKRKLKKAFEDLSKEDSITSEEASNYLMNVIDSLEHVDNTPVEMVYDGIDEYMMSLADGTFKDTSHKTLFTELDKRVMIQDGDYVTVAAHTGFGKSAFLMNIAKHFSMQGKTGLVVSGEMTKQQWLNRLLANVSGVENKRVQRRIELTKDEIYKLTKAASTVKKLNIIIHDKGGMTVEHIINKATKLKRKGKIDYIAIDHIGLLDTTKKVLGDTQKLTHISKSLKRLALNLKIPVIILSQFNRNAVDPRTGKHREPVKEDLKGSGSLAEDANIILYLYATADNVEDFVNRYIILKVGKNRDGETAKLPMMFKADKQSFHEVEYNRDTQTSTELPISKIGGAFN